MANTKLTKEQLVARFKEKHGEKYDYSLVEYVNSNVKVKIICHKHGVFEQLPLTHCRSGCRACSNDALLNLSKDEFIIQAAKIHSNKYDYSLSNYRSKLEEIVIICPNHGEFLQLPKLHLKGHGCGWCGGAKKYTNEMFIAKAREIHGSKYDYSKFNYLDFESKSIIICPEHGEFKQNPSGHFRAEGCPKCGLLARNDKHRTKDKDFIDQARLKHGLRYDYSKVKITTLKKPVTIGCQLHGYFKQAPASHLNGSNCPECVLIECRGYSRSQYIKTCEKSAGGKSNLYIIECSGNDEHFFKVGITKEDVTKRFAYGKIPYDFKLLATYKGEAGFIYDLETQLHRVLSNHKYVPLVHFGGKHECFSKIPKNILKMVLGLKKQSQMQLIT
ncbi:hypothetical protein [Acinetobacter lactucae]|uniref:hypothetical protein n=1 Tax=Acinetobacter lactucae TaxID=1785128 RepID=UPI0015F4E338|nr:hypothetical protein [Acinetobacter lactucae]